MPQGAPPPRKPSNEPALIAGLAGLVFAIVLAAVALVVPGIAGDAVAASSMVIFVISGVVLVRAALRLKRQALESSSDENAPDEDPED